MRLRERRLGWQLQTLRELAAARTRYERRRDWLTMMAIYAAHAVSRLAGGPRLRCR